MTTLLRWRLQLTLALVATTGALLERIVFQKALVQLVLQRLERLIIVRVKDWGLQRGSMVRAISKSGIKYVRSQLVGRLASRCA